MSSQFTLSNAVFISYRRQPSEKLAYILYQGLRQHKIDPFFDYQSISAGPWLETILRQIAARPYFILILAPGTLDRCADPEDILRREIQEAVNLNRTLLPLTTPDFNRDDIARFLPESLAAAINRVQNLDIPSSPSWYESLFERLAAQYLKPTPVAQITIPASDQPGLQDNQMNVEQAIARNAPLVAPTRRPAWLWGAGVGLLVLVAIGIVLVRGQNPGSTGLSNVPSDTSNAVRMIEGTAGSTLVSVADTAVAPTLTPVPVTPPTPSATTVPNTPNASVSCSGTITIQGDNTAPLCSYTINNGDSDEVKQQKKDQAQKYLGGLVLDNITNIDSRLVALLVASEPDAVSTTISNFNQTALPGVASVFNASNQQLFDQQTIDSLQSVLNRYPLDLRYDSQNPSIITSQIDPQNLQNFYDQLKEVQTTTDTLIGLMRSQVAATADSDKKFYGDQITTQLGVVGNRSQTAYLYGLLVLNDATALGTAIPDQLQSLQVLQPHTVPDKTVIAADLNALVVVAQGLNNQKQTQIAVVTSDIPTQLAGLSGTLTALPAQTDDSQAVIVGKAISLRELGSTQDAITAFRDYGAWYSSSDPTAAQYAQTAIQFTLQHQLFGVQFSASYLYSVTSGSAADKAGLKVGDVVIAYNGKMEAATDTLRFNDSFQQYLSGRPIGPPVKLTVLRLGTDNIFQQLTVTVDGSQPKLGIGFMPI